MTPFATGEAVRVTAGGYAWECRVEHTWLRNEALPDLPDAPDPVDVVQALHEQEIEAMVLVSFRASDQEVATWIALSRGEWHDMKGLKLSVERAAPQAALFEFTDARSAL